MPAFACWVKKVSVGGGAIFIRKICAECTFHKPSNGPLQGGAWQGPCGQSGYFEWGRGVCVISQECYRAGVASAVASWSASAINLETLPATSTYAWQRSPKKEIQHRLHMAKKFKRGNLTPLKPWQINSKAGSTTPL